MDHLNNHLNGPFKHLNVQLKWVYILNCKNKLGKWVSLTKKVFILKFKAHSKIAFCIMKNNISESEINLVITGSPCIPYTKLYKVKKQVLQNVSFEVGKIVPCFQPVNAWFGRTHIWEFAWNIL